MYVFGDDYKIIQCLVAFFFCRMLSSQSGELSFMRIYGQREQVPGSIIIDGMLCFFLLFCTMKL